MIGQNCFIYTGLSIFGIRTNKVSFILLTSLVSSNTLQISLQIVFPSVPHWLWRKIAYSSFDQGAFMGAILNRANLIYSSKNCESKSLSVTFESGGKHFLNGKLSNCKSSLVYKFLKYWSVIFVCSWLFSTHSPSSVLSFSMLLLKGRKFWDYYFKIL